MSGKVRTSALFILVLTLAAPVFPAAGPRLQPGRTSLHWLAEARTWWSRLLDKARCSIDPNGQTVPCSTINLEAGCSIDPDGQTVCTPEPAGTKHGCSIDPNGKPVCQ